jgi:hypothetical protein
VGFTMPPVLVRVCARGYPGRDLCWMA